MKQDELNKILELHKLWLQGDSKGERADLRGANLPGVNLIGANLREINLMLFQFNRYTAYYTYTEYLKIGCLDYTLDHWLENYREIGKEHGFSKLEIETYGEFIKLCDKVRRTYNGK